MRCLFAKQLSLSCSGVHQKEVSFWQGTWQQSKSLMSSIFHPLPLSGSPPSGAHSSEPQGFPTLRALAHFWAVAYSTFPTFSFWRTSTQTGWTNAGFLPPIFPSQRRLLLWVHPSPCKQLHSDLLHGLGWRLVTVSVPPVDLPQMLYLNHLVSTVPTRRPGAEEASKWRTGWGKRWKKGRKDRKGKCGLLQRTC